MDTTPISLYVGLECGHLTIEIIAKATRQISLPLLVSSVPDRDVSIGKGAGGRVIRLTWAGSVIEW